jgi:hypothetical protein
MVAELNKIHIVSEKNTPIPQIFNPKKEAGWKSGKNFPYGMYCSVFGSF